MHVYADIPTTLLFSSIVGLISSYLAYRRGKSPIVWFIIGALFGLLGVFALFFSMKQNKQQPSLPAPLPEPYLSGPSNKFWYYLDASNAQVGPMSHNGMISAWKKGTIPLSTLIWHEELTEWKRLEDVIQLK